MEQIKKTAELAMTNLQNLAPTDTLKTEISIYGSGVVTAECFALGIKKIKAAFPKLTIEWYKLLNDFLDTEGFTEKRFNDAVDNLIKTCKYPEPTIANILDYDKKEKLWGYEEILEYTNEWSNERRGKFWASLYFDVQLKKWREIKV